MHTIPGERVANLSNRRLWQIIGRAEQSNNTLARAKAAAARLELLARNQYCESRRWHAPG